MKKIVTVVIALFMICAMSLTAYADSTLIYKQGNKTIIFEETTPFNATQRESFIQILTQNEYDTPEPCSILCLFGHKFEAGIVRTITHEVNSYQPKCLEETFELRQCTRCDEQEVERIGYCYIICCE